MGFAVVGASAILLIAALAWTGTMVSSQDEAQQRIEAARDDATRRTLDAQATAIEITSTQYAGGPDRLTIEADNVGASVIDAAAIDIVLDGVVRTGGISLIEVEGEEDLLWTPGTSIEIRVEDVTSRPDRAWLVTDLGVSVLEVI